MPFGRAEPRERPPKHETVSRAARILATFAFVGSTVWLLDARAMVLDHRASNKKILTDMEQSIWMGR